VIDDTTSHATAHKQIIRELYELVVALDRRVPQVHRAGELSIARAAAALKAEASKRIQELEHERADAATLGIG
jgi:hypothetical protein